MLRARIATSLLAAGLGLACGCSNMSNFSLTGRCHRSRPCEAECIEAGSPVCDGPVCDGPMLQDFGPYAMPPAGPMPGMQPGPLTPLTPQPFAPLAPQPSMPPLSPAPRLQPQAQPLPYVP